MQKKNRLNQRISLADKVLLYCLNLNIIDNKEFSIPYDGCKDVYYFENYASFLNFLSENDVDVNEYRSAIHSIIFRINKKGEVFVMKHLCDYLILNVHQYDSNLEKRIPSMRHKKLLKTKKQKND